MRLEHCDDASASDYRPGGFQSCSDLCGVVSVIVKKSNATEFPVELESAIRAGKSADGMSSFRE